jgi:hypothetical protein
MLQGFKAFMDEDKLIFERFDFLEASEGEGLDNLVSSSIVSDIRPQNLL